MKQYFLSAWLMLAGLISVNAGLLQPSDRILFVGDSITGHSMNLSDGFRNQIDWALNEVYPTNSYTLLSLGGSGQGAGTWMNIATYTNTEPYYLDVPGIEVRTTLDAGADILFIMLGMNDMLAPYADNSTNGVQVWRGWYTNLIHTLRVRTNPRIIALGTITPLTEDPASPKNIARAELNRQLENIAVSEGCLLFHTGEETYNLLKRGRTLNPDFHLSTDFVHPGATGHAAIATAILNGLGETNAAQKIENRYLNELVPTNSYPTLSYEITTASHGSDTQTNTYTITYWWNAGQTSNNAPVISLDVPSDWSINNHTDYTTTGVFTVTGVPIKYTTILTFTARSGAIIRTENITIPTPWRISGGIPNPAAWPRTPNFTFNPTNSIQEYDQQLIQGNGFSAPIIADGKTYPWFIYTPSINYTGLNNPASIDPFAITYGKTFDALYATRWIYSATNRTIKLHLSSSVFAGTVGLNVWINGTSYYAGVITSEPSKSTTVNSTLNAGWNHLLIKCDHLTWQWQFACELQGTNNDTLSDLRYSAIPQNTNDNPIPSDSNDGNLVPNYSFESTNINFWSGGTIIATNTAIHGSNVLNINSTLDSHIGIQVVPSYEITFSFWSASPDIGNGHQIEYGFSEPMDGWSTGTGNTAINLYQSGGAKPFTKYSGTANPTNEQTMFYIGAMANGGYIQFDSVFVAQYGYPPPPVGTVISLE